VVAEDQFLTALLEEGAQVIEEKFGETIEVPQLDGNGAQKDDDFISLTPVEASPQLPGRAARRA
jgi:hypothetical protein